MPIHNADIAAIFEEIADLLEIEGANVFRVRAYRNAARTLQELGRDVRTMLQKGEDLTALPGIGDDLAGKMREIAETGRCAALDKLHKKLPPAITELLKIPGLGPKRVKALYHELDIHTVEQLQRAVRDHRIRSLAGFGEKTESRIAEALATHGGGAGRFKLVTAAQYAEPLAAWLRAVPGVDDVVVAGSYRRARETVGDIDILVTAAADSPVMQRFTAYDEVAEVLSHGPTRSSVVLGCRLQVDLRVVEPESHGAALHYFTGSRAHNIAIRRLGQERGLKINEYGVFEGNKRIAGETEQSVFRAVGLPFIPPELREDRGEIEAARAGRLPELVELGDLRGDLHVHTRATDGHDSLREMAEAARQRGFEYLAITEHSRRLTVAHGLDPLRLLQQIDEIDRLNGELRGITLLKGIEVDILEDGRLDLPDELLGRLDLVIGAVHSRFELSRARQTERILKAMDHPHFTLLAHPSGRLIQRREPYDVDMLRIIGKAKERGCYLELNAHPERLDLLDTYCQAAKAEGVLVSVNSDAHSVLDFDHLRFGVGQARRGWLEKGDVLNTRPLAALRPLLKRTM
ncbi:DNA polymerase/3'-5' exonuclease PolX [Methylococcus capsulatus]|jgi:DNA polymerase (family 10)|uniref:DNA polymerase beta n=1 Tax=Methylococcus capsulatus TaxID=414 RepID=A0AA35XSF9_METCP|nr:DNA polymerase/3'-5' exonuclease PolX [Methylococcus capsulatus]QXP90586.1 DNA polymerase/3'-5' exonuclease PolX [Methylococcus capsulatus]CAI8720081.1 DNA polymerase (family X) [Methylococcus capsulatus]